VDENYTEMPKRWPGAEGSKVPKKEWESKSQ